MTLNELIELIREMDLLTVAKRLVFRLLKISKLGAAPNYFSTNSKLKAQLYHLPNKNAIGRENKKCND